MKINFFRSVWSSSITLGAVALGIGSVWASCQEIRQSLEYKNYETIRVSSPTGNEIEDYQALNGEDWIVFIPGLSSTVSTLAGLADILYSKGYSVLMHNRAGYGASTVLSETPFHMGEAVTDLHAVITSLNISKSKKVHIVGHSLGGYLAYLYAEQYPDQVDSICYLDPLHPFEMVKSIAQRQGGIGVDLAVKTVTPFIPFGIPLLYRSSVLAHTFNYPYRDRVFSDLGSYSTWWSTRREWRTLYPLLLDGKYVQNLPGSIKTKVVAAGLTASSEKIQMELFNDYSKCINIIEGANHQSLVTHPQIYRQVATHIDELVGKLC